MDRREVLAVVRTAVAAEPSMMADIVEAANHGLTIALNRANDKRAAQDRAFLAVLALCDNRSRVSEGLRDSLSEIILKALPEAGGCHLENEARNRFIAKAEGSDVSALKDGRG